MIAVDSTIRGSHASRVGHWVAELVLVILGVHTAFELSNYQQDRQRETARPMWRAFSGKQKHMVEMFKGAIQHKDFALVDVFSRCGTYNKDNTYQWFNPCVKILEEYGHDPAGPAQGDRPRLPVGRRDSDWPLLTPHRFTVARRTGASAAHGGEARWAIAATASGLAQ